MKKHSTSIAGFDTLKEAASAIGKMRYDALAEFFLELEVEMIRQQKKDHMVGKPRLAHDTERIIQALGQARLASRALFNKYKKYMKEELEDTSSDT